MKKIMVTTLAVAFLSLLALPFGAMAMKSMDHGGGMSMGGDMIMLHGDDVDGVKVSGHMMDVREAMAKHGMSMTHHFMVGFTDSMGKALDSGQVALKIEKPDGTVSDPIPLMGMSGQFGSDITLDQKGMYHFMVGTKLADGKQRMFHLQHEMM